MNIYARITDDTAFQRAVQTFIANNPHLKPRSLGLQWSKGCEYVFLWENGEYAWYVNEHSCLNFECKLVSEEEIITKILSFKPEPPKPKYVGVRCFIYSEWRDVINKLIKRVKFSKAIYFGGCENEKDSCFFIKKTTDTGQIHFGWAASGSQIYTSSEYIGVTTHQIITEILNLK